MSCTAQPVDGSFRSCCKWNMFDCVQLLCVCQSGILLGLVDLSLSMGLAGRSCEI